MIEPVVILLGKLGFVGNQLFSSDNDLDFVLLILWKSYGLTDFSNHVINFVTSLDSGFTEYIIVCDGHNIVDWFFSFLAYDLHKNTALPITGIIGLLVHLFLVSGVLLAQRRTINILPNHLSVIFAVDHVLNVQGQRSCCFIIAGI